MPDPVIPRSSGRGEQDEGKEPYYPQATMNVPHIIKIRGTGNISTTG